MQAIPKMKRVQFWSRSYRNNREHWYLVSCEDNSQVPMEVWRYLNKRFKNALKTDDFRPLDPLDVYQFYVINLIKIAENIIVDDPAKRINYLIAAVKKLTCLLIKRKVLPRREEQLAIEALIGSGNFEDAQAYVESLPDKPRNFIKRRLSIECVWCTLPKLSEDAQCGLKSFLLAHASWVDAATLYGSSPQSYVYRFNHLWAPEFRAHCDWRW